MRKKDKADWCAALRSGEYKQARGQLCDAKTGAMCCLGVAYDVLWDGEWVLRGSSYAAKEKGGAKFDFAFGKLPVHVQEALGLSDEQQLTLTRMNDGWAYSEITPKNFDEIADWIEENL